MTTITRYLMNPAEDIIIFGDELAEGMWVLPESPTARCAANAAEDEQIRGQRFRRVTRLRRITGAGGGSMTIFVGEWADGYQEAHRAVGGTAWIAKKDSVPQGDR